VPPEHSSPSSTQVLALGSQQPSIQIVPLVQQGSPANPQSEKPLPESGAFIVTLQLEPKHSPPASPPKSLVELSHLATGVPSIWIDSVPMTQAMLQLALVPLAVHDAPSWESVPQRQSDDPFTVPEQQSELVLEHPDGTLSAAARATTAAPPQPASLFMRRG
jgi:hypothetical protein